MSRVRKLSIYGIRNFDPEQSRAQPIHFSRPLTLILGQNGTGKTTIIEALKYITTGDFPPNSDGGRYFIHDPLLQRDTSTKGGVKAEFVGIRGEVITVCRSLENTQYQKLRRLKTLDTTITRVDKGLKKPVTITKRCADVNAELATALGVNKAMLTYVIFCHQEDQNWPLDEGKALKEKFDQIFDIVRYNKALESMLKLSKKALAKIKILRTKRDMFGAIVVEVEGREKKLADFKKRYEEAENRIAAMSEELQPIEDGLRKLREDENKYKSLQSEEGSKKREYVLLKQQIDNLKASIKEIYTGSMDELKNEVSSYDDILRQKSNEISAVEKRLQKLNQEEGGIISKMNEEKMTVGKLKQQTQDHDKRISQRNRTLHNALSAWELDDIETEAVSQLEVKAHKKRLENKQREYEKTIERNRLTRLEDERKQQKEVDTIREEKSKIESEIELKECEINEIRDDIRQIGVQISRAGEAAKKLSIIETKLQEANNRVEELSKTLDVDATKMKIQAKKDTLNNVETSLNDVDEEINAMHQQNVLQTEVEVNETNLQQKKKEIENLERKYGDTIKDLLGVDELPDGNLKENIENMQERLAAHTKKVTREIQVEQDRLTTLQTTIKHKELELKRKERELEGDKEKISKICRYEDYTETLRLQQTKVQDLQGKRGIFDYQAIVYKEYLIKMKDKSPCCPLCHQSFDSQRKVDDLIQEMQGVLVSQPEKLKDCEVELKMEQEKYDSLLKLQPVVEKVGRVEKVELKEMKQNLELLKVGLQKSQAKMEDLRSELKMPEVKLTKCKDMIGDIALWDRTINEIQSLDATISSTRSRMLSAGVTSKRTIKEAQNEREALKIRSKRIREETGDLETSITVYNEKLQKAIEQKNTLHAEQLQIQSERQKVAQLKDKQTDLYAKELCLGDSVEASRLKLVEVDDQLKVVIEKLENIKRENWEKQESERKVAQERLTLLNELHRIQEEVESFDRLQIPELLAKSELAMEDYEKLMSDLKNSQSNYEKRINNIKNEIVSQEVRKRELVDNINLKENEQAMEVVLERCTELRRELKEINSENIENKRKILENQGSKLLREKNVLKGTKEELETQIAFVEEELQQQKYRLARTSYKEKCLEMAVQQEVEQSLRTYINVLDTAMMSYHEKRMKTVNKLIAQLWKRIYSGNDTKSIKIVTEAAVVGSKKRAYNYKLMQKKTVYNKYSMSNKTGYMEMRGRCSAGQKALASIIIRLALAETFCKQCGIMTLDEPTTNLDEANSTMLAKALNELVKMRSEMNKNFQLIVITHDEKFLVNLGDLSNIQVYHQLFRDETGRTQIRTAMMHKVENIGLDALDTKGNDYDNAFYETSDEEKGPVAKKSKKRLRS